MDSFGPESECGPDCLDWLLAGLVTALVFGALALAVARIGGG